MAPEVGLEPTTYWLTVNSPIHITPVLLGEKHFEIAYDGLMTRAKNTR